jgi:hypothetical protein
MTDAKRWFELTCRHCGGRFVEMAKLLFHRCPGRSEAQNCRNGLPCSHGRKQGRDDAQNWRRGRARRRTKGKVAGKAQGIFQAAEGRR